MSGRFEIAQLLGVFKARSYCYQSRFAPAQRASCKADAFRSQAITAQFARLVDHDDLAPT
jgi:hypothetical protein